LCLNFVLIPWKNNNKQMDEILQWVLIVIAISIPAIIVALINYFAYKKKIAAETENLKLKNKITKEITYDQLKTDNKHKNIKKKIEIFSDLNKLEAEIKNKENQTISDQKKLESLEAIKNEFKKNFVETEKEKRHQLAEDKKNLEAEKEKST